MRAGSLTESGAIEASSRLSWSRYILFSVSSQFLNAGTNALLVVLLARSLTRHGFGVQALALTILPLVIAAFRGVCLEPAVIHGYGADLHHRLWIDARRAALLCAGLTAVLPVVAHGSVEVGVLLALGAGLTVIEEAGRWLLARSDRPQVAALADLAWAVVQVSVLAFGLSSPVIVACSWAAGAAASVLVAWSAVFFLGRKGRLLIPVSAPAPETGASLPIRQGSRRSAQHLRRNRRYNWNWGLEYLTGASTAQFVLLLAPLAGSVDISGALSAAMTVTGAATVVSGGAQQLLAARLRLIRTTRAMRRWALTTSLLLGSAVVATTVPLVFIPSSLGTRLLGASWSGARLVLPAIIIQKAAIALSLGPVFVTRRLPNYRVGLWFRLPLTLATVGGALIGAAVGGARDAAFALDAGAIAAVVIWVTIVARLTRPDGGMAHHFAGTPVPTEQA